MGFVAIGPLFLGWLAAAAAAAPVPLTVETTGACPDRQAVTAALLAALRRAPPVLPDAERPRVLDLGDRFDVTAFHQTRQFVDAARDCAERARVAAVFITLALDPPALLPPPAPSAVLPEVASPLEQPVPSNPPDAGSSGSTRWAIAALAARVDGPVGAASPAAGVAAGVELRGSLGWRWFGVAATAGILTPTEGRILSVNLHEQRFPLSLAFTAWRRLWREVRAAGALGVCVVPLTLRGDRLMTSSPATRLDTGGRAAIELTLGKLVWGVAPFVGVHAEYFPRPYVLDVSPLGAIGSTHRLWLGFSAGIAIGAP